MCLQVQGARCIHAAGTYRALSLLHVLVVVLAVHLLLLLGHVCLKSLQGRGTQEEAEAQAVRAVSVLS
jgi:hypothetical protein